MGYFLAPSLVQLRDEINDRFPGRDKSSDGWIGDPSHAARVSSHNPLWSAPGKWSGVVRATDTDNNGSSYGRTPLVSAILEAAIGDSRCWYVIYGGKIYSRTYGWAARRYTGSNPHDKHVHISLRETVDAWSDTSRWIAAPEKPKRRVRPGPVDASNVREQFLIAAGAEKGKREALIGVRRIQQALNDRYSTGLEVDGWVGEATLNAWGRHEKRTGQSGRPRVPDEKSLANLSRGKFRVVD